MSELDSKGPAIDDATLIAMRVPDAAVVYEIEGDCYVVKTRYALTREGQLKVEGMTQKPVRFEVYL